MNTPSSVSSAKVHSVNIVCVLPNMVKYGNVAVEYQLSTIHLPGTKYITPLPDGYITDGEIEVAYPPYSRHAVGWGRSVCHLHW